MLQQITKTFDGYTFSKGGIFTGYVVATWVLQIIKDMGRKPYESSMLLPGIAMCLGFLAVMAAVDFLLARLHISTPARSALWFAAVLGPYASLLVEKAYQSEVWSHIAGVFAAVLAFAFSYWIEQWFARRSQRTPDGSRDADS